MKPNLTRRATSALLATVLLSGVVVATNSHAAEVTPAEARAIAKEAYIYGYPMVDSYRIQYAYFADKDDK